MTSHKYLSKKKGAAYTFFSGLSTALVPGVIIAVIELVVFAIAPAVRLSNLKDALAKTSKTVSDSYKFMSSILEETFLSIAILIMLAALSIFTAVMLLRFMADKRTVNVYYSLGIKRRTLFTARYFAGAVMLTLAPIIAVVAGYIVNLSFIGLSWQLSITYLHIFFGIWLFSLLAYTVTAAVFSSVGTVSEGIVYSLGVMALPTVILYSLQNLIATFLPSSTYNTTIIPFDPAKTNLISAGGSLVDSYLRYNPLLFFAKELTAFSEGKITADGLMLADDSVFKFPSFGISMFWIPFIILFAVLGCIFFTRRNAENCGFLNTNKVLSNAVLFELLMLATSVPLIESYYYELKELLIISAVAATGVYILFEIFLKRNFKRIIKALYKLPAHAAVIAIIIGIFSSGLFGFATRVPSSTEVKSVAVSIPASISTLQVSSNYNYYQTYSENPFLCMKARGNYSELPEMTSESDIGKVRTLHDTLVKDNTDSKDAIAVVTFRYTLSSGRTMSRKAFVKNAALLKETVKLFDTDAVKAQIEALLGTDWSKLKNDEGKFIEFSSSSAAYGALIYENSSVSFESSTLQENYGLDLTKDEFYALKDAVKKDLLAQTSDDMFFGTSKMLGVLSFKSTAGFNDFEGMTEIDEPVSMPGAVDSDYENALPIDDDETVIEPDGDEAEDENNKLHYSKYSLTDIFGESDRNYNIPVTEKMTNTVNVLKKLGFEEVFASRLKIKSVSFIKLDFSSYIEDFYDRFTVLFDMTAYASAGGADRFDVVPSADELLKDYSENIVTDQKKIAEVAPLLSLRRYASAGDYICVVRYDDDTFSCYPLSASSAPDFVTSYNYKK